MELLEIEKELAGPASQDAFAKHDGVLARLAGRLRAAMDAGMPPEEFGKCAPLAEAVVVARKLLRLQVRGV